MIKDCVHEVVTFWCKETHRNLCLNIFSNTCLYAWCFYKSMYTQVDDAFSVNLQSDISLWCCPPLHGSKHKYILTYIHTCIYIHTYIHIYICMYMCMCVCACFNISAHACMHIVMYTYLYKVLGTYLCYFVVSYAFHILCRHLSLHSPTKREVCLVVESSLSRLHQMKQMRHRVHGSIEARQVSKYFLPRLPTICK